jgi:hypothetical protein
MGEFCFDMCCLTRGHRLDPCVYYSVSRKAQHCPATVPLTLFRRGRGLSPAVAVQDINIAAEGEGEGTAAPAAVPDAVVVDAAAAAPAEPTASE